MPRSFAARHRACATWFVTLLSAASAACSDPKAPVGLSRDGDAIAFQGTLSLAVRQPNGEIRTEEGRWSANTRMQGGAAVGRPLPTDASTNPEALLRLAVGDRPAPLPLLALSASHRLATWDEDHPTIDRFVDGGKEYTVVIEGREAHGPPSQVTLFENQRPSQLIRFEWKRSGDLWIAARTAVTVWQDGAPLMQFVARVDGEGSRLAARGEAATLLAQAAERVESIIVPVLSAALLPAPAQAQLYFYQCRYEWLKVFKLATTMAILVSGIGTLGALVDVLLSVGLVPQLFDYFDAVWKLVDCVSEASSSGGADTVAPPLPPGPRVRAGATPAMPGWVRSALEDLKRHCDGSMAPYSLCS